jgi:hypothetical protein
VQKIKEQEEAFFLFEFNRCVLSVVRSHSQNFEPFDSQDFPDVTFVQFHCFTHTRVQRSVGNLNLVIDSYLHPQSLSR